MACHLLPLPKHKELGRARHEQTGMTRRYEPVHPIYRHAGGAAMHNHKLAAALEARTQRGAGRVRGNPGIGKIRAYSHRTRARIKI
jgi:hypothetical protein